MPTIINNISNDSGNIDNYSFLIETYRKSFPNAPEPSVARAPGRVNVIGEHTDYNGLPVLPTAIDREVSIAFSGTGSSQICLVNLDERFTRRDFTVSSEIEHYPRADWGNYAKAAAQGLWKWAAKHSPQSLPLQGFQGCVGGSIPPGSGLSSSSALVVAVAVALVEINKLVIDKLQLATLLAKAERYVGTAGGGMDQAASILSRSGNVLKIDFSPLRVEYIPFPGECALIIANSMVHANKAGAARNAYNMRVAECRLSVQMLKYIAVKNGEDISDVNLLGDFMRRSPEWRKAVDSMPDQPMLLDEIAEYCSVDVAWLKETFLKSKDISGLQIDNITFKVKQRCMHVLSEAERVELSMAAMRENRLSDLGRFMNESHKSCAHDYEISCPEMDKLVSLLRHHGALGARLTGAGFGGCAVALASFDAVESILKGTWQDYYIDYISSKGVSLPQNPQDVLFRCIPSDGAGIVAVSDC